MALDTNRRRFLTTAASASVIGLAGCSGDDLDSGGSNVDGPSPPWTTEDLAEAAQEEDKELVIYNTSATQEGWDVIVDAIQEEYPFFEVEAIQSSREDMAQRFLQEKQADDIQADVVMNVPPLYRDEDPADHFVENVDDFEIFEQFPDGRKFPYGLGAMTNYGPISNMVFNTDQIEELEARDILEAIQYNALFEDLFEGETLLMDESPNWVQFNGIVREFTQRHPDYESEEEWFASAIDQFDLQMAESATPGTRLVGQGQAPLQFQSYTVVFRRVNEPGLPIEDIVFDGSPYPLDSYNIMEVDGAPHPWNARFLRSVMMEDWVQQAMAEAGDATPLTPGRTDVDYSGTGIDDYTLRLLDTELEFIENIDEYRSRGQEIFNSVLE